eukprot:SM000064S19776  [mRNA]  locus=s64:395367:396236:- [translate_table: standard]
MPLQLASYEDDRGRIMRVAMGGGVVANLLHTMAGKRRSGDIHSCTQFDILLRGRTNLHLHDLTLGTDKVLNFEGSNTLIKIPPRVPHLFEFLEESFVIEWWECSFRAWYTVCPRDSIHPHDVTLARLTSWLWH